MGFNSGFKGLSRKYSGGSVYIYHIGRFWYKITVICYMGNLFKWNCIKWYSLYFQRCFTYSRNSRPCDWYVIWIFINSIDRPSWRLIFMTQMHQSWSTSYSHLWHLLWMHHMIHIMALTCQQKWCPPCLPEKLWICSSIVSQAKKQNYGTHWEMPGLFQGIADSLSNIKLYM